MKRQELFIGFFLVFVCLYSVKGYSTGFEVYPSVRAAGMAGAYVAVADDLSSFWFNPAGLALREFSNHPYGLNFQIYEYDMDSLDPDNIYGYPNQKGSFSLVSKSFSIFYAQPYNIVFYIPQDPKTDNNTGQVSERIEETISEYGIAKGFTLYNGESLKFFGGIVLGINKIEYDYQNFTHSSLNLENSESFYSLSAGFLMQFYSKNKTAVFSIGGNYKSESLGDFSDKNSTLYNDGKLFKKPESYSVGCAIKKTFKERFTLIFSYQHEQTQWDKANMVFNNYYKRDAIGGEIQFNGKNATFSIRSGYSKSKPSQSSWGEISSTTFGVGWFLHHTIRLNFAVEKQNYNENIYNLIYYEQTITYFSCGYSF